MLGYLPALEHQRSRKSKEKKLWTGMVASEERQVRQREGILHWKHEEVKRYRALQHFCQQVWQQTIQVIWFILWRQHWWMNWLICIKSWFKAANSTFHGSLYKCKKKKKNLTVTALWPSPVCFPPKDQGLVGNVDESRGTAVGSVDGSRGTGVGSGDGSRAGG